MLGVRRCLVNSLGERFNLLDIAKTTEIVRQMIRDIL